MVEEVVEDTAAAEAGIEKGNLILGIEGTKIKDLIQLRQTLSRFEAGQEIEVEVQVSVEDGDDEEKTVTVTLGAPPAPKEEGPQIEPPKIR